jgi:hypothetical protein
MKKAYFYVCGDAANMAREVNAILAQILAEQRGISEAKAEEIVKNMRAANQYQVSINLPFSQTLTVPRCSPLVPRQKEHSVFLFLGFGGGDSPRLDVRAVSRNPCDVLSTQRTAAHGSKHLLTPHPHRRMSGRKRAVKGKAATGIWFSGVFSIASACIVEGKSGVLSGGSLRSH